MQTLALVTGFFFVVRQIKLAQQQNSISHLNYFRELWLSEPILRARQSFLGNSSEVDGNLRPHEDTIVQYFNDIGIAIRTGQVDEGHVVRFFGYFIEGFWLSLVDQIKRCRETTSDPSIYGSFEHLYELVISANAKNGIAPFTQARLTVFVREEAGLARFYLNIPG